MEPANKKKSLECVWLWAELAFNRERLARNQDTGPVHKHTRPGHAIHLICIVLASRLLVQGDRVAVCELVLTIFSRMHTLTHTEKVKNTIRQTGNHSLGI